MFETFMNPLGIALAASGALFALWILFSFRRIGETEIGVVTKVLSFRGLAGPHPIAFNGEGGYQAHFLKAGLYWYPLFVYTVRKLPRPQVPPKEVGVVFAQVGAEPPAGARTVKDVGPIELYGDLDKWLKEGGQKGIQRQVLPPGTSLAVHPVAFLVITRTQVFGIPIDPDLRAKMEQGNLTPESFGISPDDLKQVEIRSITDADGRTRDAVGVVYARDGAPLPAGSMAGRIGGFKDFLVDEVVPDSELVERILKDQLAMHNSFQDFSAFIKGGGSNGLQFDVLRPGTYNLNPVCVSVSLAPMLEVSQGEVAVIKAFEGRPTKDVSGSDFKFGSLVKPGWKGVWQESLRTGKYLVNPHLFAHEIVPTSIVNLNWADNQTSAHELDRDLKSIHAKSKDGFDFSVGLVVQIHIPDTLAPRVISSVGTVRSLVNDVLQAAVGNYVRDTIQSMVAVDFIEKRDTVQQAARTKITERLKAYDVECVNVLIQDVKYPDSLTVVLQERTIAHERKMTFEKQKEAEVARIAYEEQKGIADMQSRLATANIGVGIAAKEAEAKVHQAKGEAALIAETGKAEAEKTKAIGLAKAEGYTAQVAALGQGATALTNIATVLGENHVKIVPDIMSMGGEGGVGGMVGALTSFLSNKAKPSETPSAAN